MQLFILTPKNIPFLEFPILENRAPNVVVQARNCSSGPWPPSSLLRILSPSSTHDSLAPPLGLTPEAKPPSDLTWIPAVARQLCPQKPWGELCAPAVLRCVPLPSFTWLLPHVNFLVPFSDLPYLKAFIHAPFSQRVSSLCHCFPFTPALLTTAFLPFMSQQKCLFLLEVFSHQDPECQLLPIDTVTS